MERLWGSVCLCFQVLKKMREGFGGFSKTPKTPFLFLEFPQIEGFIWLVNNEHPLLNYVEVK